MSYSLAIYESELPHPIVRSKICERESISVTTHGSASNAANFYEDLIRRDARCVVSGTEVPVSASHLIPKCIGSDGARDIVERYVGATEATGIHQFDPRIGITLLKSVGHWVTLLKLVSTTLR
jgi:hypothetical protein